MKKLLIAGFVLVALLACNKDKYQTKPQISLRSIGGKVVPVNGVLNVVLNYTDKEGDISDSMFIKKIRLNKTVVATLRDSLRYKIPDFPNYDKGQIDLALQYQNHLISASNPPPIPGSNPSVPQPDTLVLKFWIRDKAGHVSDTVTTDQIVIIR